MRGIDLLRLPLTSLAQQKLRTALTTLGVVFGAFVLAASLAIDEGVQQTIEREASRGDAVRRIRVYSQWRSGKSKAKEAAKVVGRMAPARRERIQRALDQQAQRGDSEAEPIALTSDRLAALAKIPHVARLVPVVGDGVVATLGNRPEAASITSGAGEVPEFARRIIVGRALREDDGRAVLLSEMFAYRIGLKDDTDLDQVLGKPLRIEVRGREDGPSFAVSLTDRTRPGSSDRAEQAALRQLAWQIPGVLDRLSLTDEEIAALRRAIRPGSTAARPPIVAEFRVVGIFRELTDEERKSDRVQFPTGSDLILPRRAAVDLVFRDPDRREQGVAQAVLFVDDMRNVKEVVDQVEATGLGSQSIVEFIEQQRLTYLLIFGGMTCVAGVALLVSALGIANTMLMSVLERRREIGIMKAVGATARQLQVLFLIEGAAIGLVGGSLGLALAWAISFPGDAWVRSMVSRDMKIDLTGSIFAFQARTGGIVLLFTVGVTLLAALYPARRAATVDPIAALRHD